MTQTAVFYGVFSIGIIVSILGAIKIPLAARLGIDDARSGGLIAAMQFTSLVSGFFIGPVIDTAGFAVTGAGGFFFGALAVALLVSARTYLHALIACVFLGFGGMCLNIFINILLQKVLFGGMNAPAALNLGHAVFGVGAFLTPLAIGMMVSRVGLRATGAVFTAVLLVGLYLSASSLFPATGKGFSILAAMSLLRDPAILVITVALICYVGLESSMGGWITTYAVDTGFTPKRAELLLAGFWATFALSRVVASIIMTTETEMTAIPVLAGVASCSIGGMIVSRSPLKAAAGVIVTGLAFGPIFPTVVSVMLSHIPPGIAGSGFGMVSSLSFIGGVFLPAAVGVRSRNATIRTGLILVLFVTLVLLAVTSLLNAMA